MSKVRKAHISNEDALQIAKEITIARLGSVESPTTTKAAGQAIGEMFVEIFKAVQSVVEE